MRRRRFTFTLGRLAAFVAVAATLSWPGAATAVAQTPRGGKDKVSADLRQKLTAGGKVNVVIKSVGAWNTTLDSAVKAGGGAGNGNSAYTSVASATTPNR